MAEQANISAPFQKRISNCTRFFVEEDLPPYLAQGCNILLVSYQR